MAALSPDLDEQVEQPLMTLGWSPNSGTALTTEYLHDPPPGRDRPFRLQHRDQTRPTSRACLLDGDVRSTCRWLAGALAGEEQQVAGADRVTAAGGVGHGGQRDAEFGEALRSALGAPWTVRRGRSATGAQVGR
jgi:hypothetical protein